MTLLTPPPSTGCRRRGRLFVISPIYASAPSLRRVRASGGWPTAYMGLVSFRFPLLDDQGDHRRTGNRRMPFLARALNGRSDVLLPVRPFRLAGPDELRSTVYSAVDSSLRRILSVFVWHNCRVPNELRSPTSPIEHPSTSVELDEPEDHPSVFVS